jgi:hypothetical protein
MITRARARLLRETLGDRELTLAVHPDSPGLTLVRCCRCVTQGMRSGDTDYLRFILRYLAVRRGGLPPVPAGAAPPGGDGANGFPDLCSNMDVQTEEFKQWSAGFAALFAAHVKFPGGVSVEEVTLLLAKIRANSLGFPFTPDGETTLGWCLHSAASRFNHSCAPNCCVVSAETTEGLRGALLVRTKKVGR